MPSPDEERSDKPSAKAPAREVRADVMVVRTRPSVHGNSLPQTLPRGPVPTRNRPYPVLKCSTQKLLTKGRYELSSVKSSSTYPQTQYP